MVKAYYDKHAAAVPVPEQVKAEYVVLEPGRRREAGDASATPKSPMPTTRTRPASPTPEKRSASHILITVPQGRQAGRRRRRQGQGRSHPGRSAQEPERLREDRQGAVAGPGLGRTGRRPRRRREGRVRQAGRRRDLQPEGRRDQRPGALRVRLPHRQGDQGRAGGAEDAGRSQAGNRRRPEEAASCRTSTPNWPRPSPTPCTSRRTA